MDGFSNEKEILRLEGEGYSDLFTRLTTEWNDGQAEERAGWLVVGRRSPLSVVAAAAAACVVCVLCVLCVEVVGSVCVSRRAATALPFGT